MSADRGSASVYTLAVAAVLLLMGAAETAFGAAVVARHRASAAADLGALAGAVALNTGRPRPCQVARRTVRANGARLVSCEVIGTDMLITVAVRPAGPPRAWGEARGAARAGPGPMEG